MAKKKPVTTDLTEQSVALAEFAAKALVAAEQLGAKKKVVDGFSLDDSERAIAADLPGLSATLKKKLAKTDATFTVADTASIVMAVAESLLEGEPLKRLKLLFITKKLTDCLQTRVVPAVPAKSKAKKARATLSIYQFKITLLGSKPPIWRRIQIPDCTLDKLHEHIQTAMGWTNSHLHQFEIKGKRYGDPELLNDGFEDSECFDSTKTNLSDILPKTRKRFALKYEYDFGDGWEHEVYSRAARPPIPSRNTRCAWKASGPARQRTAAGFGATAISSKRSAIPSTMNTRACWSGSGAGSTRTSSIRSRRRRR
jgi:hypothetical protein